MREFHAMRSAKRQAEIEDESKDGARFRWLIDYQGPAIWGYGKQGRLDRVRKFIDDEIRTDQADIRSARAQTLLAHDKRDKRQGGNGGKRARRKVL